MLGANSADRAGAAYKQEVDSDLEMVRQFGHQPGRPLREVYGRFNPVGLGPVMVEGGGKIGSLCVYSPRP